MSLIDALRLRLGSSDGLLLLAIVGLAAGLLGGASNVLFRLFTESSIVLWHPKTDQGDFEGLPWEVRLVMPIIGGILVGLFLQRLRKHRRAVGVGHVLERLIYHQGYLSWKNALVQFFVGGLSLSSGMSVGREGPGIHLGAASGSWLGQQFHLPNNSIRILVGCGTAAAISASFNTPLAGVIFAMEVVMMEYTIVSFIPVILASVSGAVLTRIVFGSDTAFIVPSLTSSLWEIPFFIVMGILIGILATLFIVLTTRIAIFTQKWPIWIKCACCGVIVGTIAIGIPQIMGIGYDSVNATLHGEYTLVIILLCLVGKFFATVSCSGMSLPGGVIGPTLFIGAMAGAALGYLAHWLFPDHSSSYPFYAMIGMATMMSAVLQAPLAALMALLELTSNPGIILPGMLSVVIANMMVTQIFKQKSIYQSLMNARGMDMRISPIAQFLRRVGVAGVMERSIATHERDISINEAEKLLESTPRWLLVQENHTPVALMSANDLARHLIGLKENTENDDDDEQTENITENIDLLKIPADRQNIASIYLQATLEQALDSMNTNQVDAVYIYRKTAPMNEKIYGVITRESIDSYYTYNTSTASTPSK